MKKYTQYIFIPIMLLVINSVNAQQINWAALKESKHVITLNVGLEQGLIYGLGYGYKINSKLIPIITHIEYSFPSGDKLYDDFKTKVGVQIRWFEVDNLQLSTKVDGIFRRHENDLVRLVNFGSDVSGIIGYYRSKYFVGGEVGFDKAIVTNFKHSKAYKDQYPGAEDGWYDPSTGGNFYYGIHSGFSLGKQDIVFRAGKILTQDFKTQPTLPFYGQLGVNIKF
jgi:hypothetical protein